MSICTSTSSETSSSPKSNTSDESKGLIGNVIPIQYLTEEFEPYVRRRKRNDKDKNKNKIAELDETDQLIVRTCINSRERKRMHDLNNAMEDLRQSLPYSQNANCRKMSKINTLILATSWIKQMTKTNEDLRKQLEDLQMKFNSITNGKPLKEELIHETSQKMTTTPINNNTNKSTPTPNNCLGNMPPGVLLPINSIPQTFNGIPPNPFLFPFLGTDFSLKMPPALPFSAFSLYSQSPLINK
uniref:BHLH domain-containing protein n=1 Tax=Parastrongyloides trichosuri TaxID=131310 RepID=A0A0N4Z637_PARTI